MLLIFFIITIQFPFMFLIFQLWPDKQKAGY